MDIILLGITVVSLIVALVMSVAAWRVTRDEKKRSAARVAALSVAAGADEHVAAAPIEKPAPKAPWSSPPAPIVPAEELSLHQPAQAERMHPIEPVASHASGFLGSASTSPESGGGQKALAFAAVVLFMVLSAGLVWLMSGPRGTSAVAVGPNSPLELVSLTHARRNDKLAVSGLVRNPASATPIERLSAVVFLFDRMGTFVMSSRANVDYLKIGAGDESPFVVLLDAPPTVTRYRVSFRTDDGLVPHVDRRDAAEAVNSQESTVKSSVSSQQ